MGGGQLPGVNPESIEVTVEKDTLTVKAERTLPEREDAETLVSERQYGSFSRQLSLGQSLDTERISASYVNGVLTLSVPIAEQAKARRVEITTESKQNSIDAKSTQAA